MGKLLGIPPAGSGLPVHRLPGTSKAGVFAYANELADWLKPPESAGSSPALSAAEISVEVPAHIVAPARVPLSGVSWAAIAALAAIAWNYPLASRQTAAHVTNPEAEDLYLKGRHHWNKRTPDDLNQALPVVALLAPYTAIPAGLAVLPYTP